MSEAHENSRLAELVINHYQNTYEVTYELWRARNRLFPTLAGIAGAGALLAFRVPGAEPLFIGLLGSLLRLDPAQQTQLQSSFPFQILQTVILVVVFHLMLDLYRHTLDIARSYSYLAGLEAEIRQFAGFPEKSVAFTREDRFYQTHRPLGLGGGIRWVYTLVLGLLLAIFLYARIWDDLHQGNWLFMVVNIAIALPTLFYFVAYAFPTLGMKRIPKKP